jgi:hypothetical protein
MSATPHPRLRFFLHTFQALTIAGLLLGPMVTESRAQSPSKEQIDKAKTLAKEAKEAFDSGDFSTALALYGRADKVLHTIPLALGIARSQARLRKLLDARASYEQIVRDGAPAGASPPVLDAVAAASREHEALIARIPTVSVTLKGPTKAFVRLDGSPINPEDLGKKTLVDPGPHTAEVAETSDFLAARVTQEATEGAHLELLLAPEPKAAPPPPDRDGDGIVDQEDACPDRAGVSSSQPRKNGCPAPVDTDHDGIPDEEDACPRKAGVKNRDPDLHGCPVLVTRVPPPVSAALSSPAAGAAAGDSALSTAASVAFVVGGFSLLTGAATGGYTLIKNQDLKDKCPNQHCPQSERDTLPTYNALRQVSTATFIAGGGVLFVGSLLYVLAPSKPASSASERSPRLGLSLSPSSVGLQGAF